MRVLKHCLAVICSSLLLPIICQANIIATKLSSPRFYQPITQAYVYSQNKVPVYRYKILKVYPHNPASFTEGLVMNDGLIFEGTGLYGQSKLLKNNLPTGKVMQQFDLPKWLFGEGVTVLGDEVFQLTYRAKTGFVYDKKTFKLKRRFFYHTQGWGLTTDGKALIMSDGSANLYFFTPDTFQPIKQLLVTDQNGPIGLLNELEYVDGQIYANIWQSNIIAKISAKTGKITAWLDLTGLNPNAAGLKGGDVLNGIAYDQRDKKLIVTGKRWPKMYKIKIETRD